jgi:serine phosphatase RsbU (regulator of sigma subunit)
MSVDKPIRMVVASDQAIFLRGLASIVKSQAGLALLGQGESGADAIHLCDIIKPDILILDFKLKPEQAIDLIKTLRRRSPQLRIIYFYSVYVETQWQEYQDDEQVYFFLKDISEEEFASALRDIIAHTHARLERNEVSSEQAATPTASMDYWNSKLEPGPQASVVASEQPIDARDRELRMAGRVQADILPEKLPIIPGWDISAKLISARETSGDFYDFIPFHNQRWGMVVADVTDKGIGAALFMALSSTLIRTYAVRYPTLPALAMDIVNERIFSDTRGSLFVTCFYGVLEANIGRLRFVNAGHPPGLLFSSNKGKLVDHLRTTGMALGMIEKTHWRQKIVKISHGDILLLYTDGVSESQSPSGGFYSNERLVNVLRSNASASAQNIQEAILEDLRIFTGRRHEQDDIALVVIKRN